MATKFAESAYNNGCHDNHNGSLEGKKAKPDENIQRADTRGKYEQEQERAEEKWPNKLLLCMEKAMTGITTSKADI